MNKKILLFVLVLALLTPQLSFAGSAQYRLPCGYVTLTTYLWETSANANVQESSHSAYMRMSMTYHCSMPDGGYPETRYDNSSGTGWIGVSCVAPSGKISRWSSTWVRAECGGSHWEYTIND